MTYSFTENQWGEKYIEELNRNDFTSMKSEEFFDRILSFNLEEENTFFVVCGSDSGLLLNWLKRQAIGRGSHVAVIEHDAAYDVIAPLYRGLLNRQSTHADSSANPFDTNVSFHKDSLWKTSVLNNPHNKWLTGGATAVVESHASSADYARLYMTMHRNIKIAVRERLVQLTTAMNHSVFTQMQFQNAADNALPLKSSKSFGKGKTAVVLGGGPSIDFHLPWIEENREQLFVIVVSRIAGKLVNRNLTPDLVVSIDPYDFSYEVCKPGLVWTDVPLANNYHVSPKLLQQWQAATFYMGNRLPWLDKTHDSELMSAAGPTVGHAAAIVAGQLGFTQILMSGIDLCFNNSASTHDCDSPEEMIQSMPTMCDAQVVTYAGNMAGTNIELKNYVIELDKYGAYINKEQPILFNLNEHAAQCSSIPHIGLHEVVLSGNKPDFKDHVQCLKPQASAEDLEWLEKEYQRASFKFEKIRALCKDAKQLVEKAHSSSDNSSSKNYTLKLQKLRKTLDQDYSDYLQAIIHYNKKKLIRAETPTEFDDMTPEELVKWGQNYYNIIDSGAKDMLAYIKEHSPRIQLRLQELEPNVDIRALMTRWRDDDTPARLFRWKSHFWQKVDPKDRAWVQRTVGKLRSNLNAISQTVSENLLSKNENIFTTVKSLVFLHQHQKHEELASIESRLSNEEWPYSALKPFTAGLIAHLKDDAPLSITHFQSTIDICSEKLENESEPLDSMLRLIEECLVRMTQCFIKIDDHESALGTLGMLCEILPTYVVSYAKMLNLHGQREFAIELLSSYTELYPSNKKAQFILDELQQNQSTQQPTQQPSDDPEDNAVYVNKIAGAVQAIMGN